MRKKIFVIILMFNILGFVNSCECPPEKYYDYTSLIVSAYDPVIEQSERMSIEINIGDKYYLASNANQSRFANSAYATSTCEKGYAGEKYPLIGISVTSDSDFNDEFPAGSELSSIVKVYGTDSNGTYGEGYLNQFTIENTNPGFYFLDLRPDADPIHIFTVTFEKSNGEFVSVEVPPITWE